MFGIIIIRYRFRGIIFGALGDKYGRKKVLQWTIIIYSLGTLLCVFSWDFYSLLIFRFITGLGVGGEWATGQIYISETFPVHSIWTIEYSIHYTKLTFYI